MAVPELVFCPSGDSYKRYPGGVFAVAASDHLAAARGTLSTEADALSAGGTVVRDTQQVNNIRANTSTAYQAADDTLEITGVPFLDGRTYDVWGMFKVEGYTDPTDGPLLRDGFHENYVNAGVVGLHTTSEASNQRFATSPPALPFYRALRIGFKVFNTGDTYKVRLASESGTTIEWLLDQLIFIVSPNNDATVDDNTEFFGFGAGDTTLNTSVTTQDGADGGDDNGKFTWFPRNPPDLASPGDFQRYADGDDAEYFSQVTTDDGLTFWSTGDEEAASAWMYSCHTAMCRDPVVWAEDTYDNRDTSAVDQDMGVSPDGFGYAIGTVAGPGIEIAHTDGGGTAVMSISAQDGAISTAWGSLSVGSGATQNQGMRFQLYDQFSWKTIWAWTDGAPVAGGARNRVLLQNTVWGQVEVRFDIPEGVWRIIHPVTGAGTDHDISAWFGITALVGIRIEVLRYRIRVRVWDASGAEPSTWDEEQFLDYVSPGGASAYPYGDNEVKSSRINSPFSLAIQLESLDAFFFTGPLEITLYNQLVEHDPYGDPADMTARFYRPPATSLGDMVIPFGTSYFVYWGKRDWTDSAFGSDWLEYSLKVWNDPAAAEIQRAEVVTYYFFWYQDVSIAEMHWKSGDRDSHVWRLAR